MGLNPVVVAVDGGGSKMDAVAVDLAGMVVGRAVGPGGYPQFGGLARSVAQVDGLVRAVAGGAPVVRAGLYLSGLDLPQEVWAYRDAVAGRDWASCGIDVENDLFALLRAGTREPDAVAVVCGTGINAIGRRADGADVRFASLGRVSGDWGGGGGLGEEAMWHAARAEDGRGPATELATAVRDHFEVASIADLIAQFHFGQRETDQLRDLSPDVLRLADSDAVAGALVDRQADEVVTMAVTCLRRLHLLEAAVPVVLGGGVLRSGNRRLMDGIAAGLAAAAPLARIVHVSAPPILGAALLTLEAAGAPASALEATTEALRHPA
jgi:N-acetylglucosamine kinase-like BadF-type ATPase